MEKIKIKYHKKYLQAFMPNGDLIPGQVDMHLNNGMEHEDFAYVTIKCVADLTDLQQEGVDLVKELEARELRIIELETELKHIYKPSFIERIFG